jgi:hypothetical protein
MVIFWQSMKLGIPNFIGILTMFFFYDTKCLGHIGTVDFLLAIYIGFKHKCLVWLEYVNRVRINMHITI